jgi:hypothetical protein
MAAGAEESLVAGVGVACGGTALRLSDAVILGFAGATASSNFLVLGSEELRLR